MSVCEMLRILINLNRERISGIQPVGEIYVYFAIRIYATVYIEQELVDYWNEGPEDPIPITKYMTKIRFLELHMRFRVHPDGLKGIYTKVINLSQIVKF
jgi:hypothetical protein